MKQILSAVVGLRAHIPEEARTAEVLGTERVGSGIVIEGQGLVLTIGYLIMEADSVVLAPRPGEGPEVMAEVLAYDHDTGFGLVRAMEPLDGVSPIAFGDSDIPAVGSALIDTVGGQSITGMADFYRKLWSLGGPGDPVPLTLLTRKGGVEQLSVTAGDRYRWLRMR